MKAAGKIAHITTVHKPFDNRIFKQCRTMRAAGFTVVLIVPCEEDQDVDGVKIRAVRERKGRLGRMTMAVWEAYRRAIRERADVYHFHDPEFIPAGIMLRTKGHRVVFDVHENVPHQLLYKAWLPRSLRAAVSFAYDHLEKLAAGMFSAVVTANEDINERFIAINQNVLAVHNYSDLSEFLDLPMDPERYSSGRVLHCGGVTCRTSVEAVVNAIGRVPEIDLRLIITGPSDSPKLTRHLESLQGWRRVRVMGLLPREEMLALLGTAAVSVVLYDRLENHASIRSNRLYESMAAGLPVIVPHFPEWKRTVEEIGCGIAVDPLDPEAIAEALSWLLQRPHECAAMGARGRSAVRERFNWTSERLKLGRLYEQLLSTARA